MFHSKLQRGRSQMGNQKPYWRAPHLALPTFSKHLVGALAPLHEMEEERGSSQLPFPREQTGKAQIAAH